MDERTRKRVSTWAWGLTLACPVLAVSSTTWLSGGWAVASGVGAIVLGVLAAGLFAATHSGQPRD